MRKNGWLFICYTDSKRLVRSETERTAGYLASLITITDVVLVVNVVGQLKSLLLNEGVHYSYNSTLVISKNAQE